MVNELLDSITTELYTSFGYACFVETVKQELPRPCFTVDIIDSYERSTSAKTYHRSIPIAVHYFSSSRENVKKDCLAIAELVVNTLEYIPLKGKKLRGEHINWRIIDDEVLQVLLTYDFDTQTVIDLDENMEEIQQKYK